MHVSLCVLFHILNHYTDIHETKYEPDAIEGHSRVELFNFLQFVTTWPAHEHGVAATVATLVTLLC
jgi:hypothetical protein